MEVVSAVVSVVGLIVSVGVAIFVAKNYGDVAGAKVILEAQAKDAARARVAAFQSLVNEVERIRAVVGHYNPSDVRAESRGVPQMPVAAFETAFVSGAPALAASEELVRAACDYLVHADSVNSLIGMYQPGPVMAAGRVTFQDVCRACAPIPEILDRLDDCLRHELEEAQLTIDELGS
jgi:hypothetical protein